MLEGLCCNINKGLRTGIHEEERFAAVALSAASRDLPRRNLRHGVELIDLGRQLLEDAYPGGIAPRLPIPTPRPGMPTEWRT